MRLQVDRDLRAGKAVGQTFPAPRAVPGRSTVVGGGEPSLGAGPLTIAVAVGALVLLALDALLLGADRLRGVRR